MNNSEITRRRFVKGTIVTGAAAAVPAAAQAATEHKSKTRHAVTPKGKAPSSRRADVVVIGAGLAGLTAARRIAQRGRSVIVLEARNRVGGRTWNHDLGGGHLSERGGTFVGPTQDHIQALMGELGIGKFPTYDTGLNVYVADGQRSTYSDTGITGTAPLDPTILADLTAAVTELDQMATQVSVDAPWQASQADAWDGQTLETWLLANSHTTRFRELAAAATRPIFGAEPRELSLLFVVFYIASSGDEHNQGTFERNFDTRAGAQESRVVGGTQLISTRMTDQLGGTAGGTRGRVVLSTPVRRITQSGSGVTVVSDHLTVRAKQAIVAIPPALAARIDYEPILPFERDQLTQRFGQGTLTKVAAVYDRPFWRDAGLNGTAVATGGPVSATFDDSPQDGSLGVIFGFVGGDWARTYNAMSPASRRQAVLNQFSTFFGPEAATPRDYFETSWSSEQWTRGCPVGILAPGVLLAYGSRIRAPVGRLHWAGTETANYWNGYMDGAVRSGERAASEVLAAL